MKKKTLIVIILCVLVAAVITLSVTGIIAPQDGGSLAGNSGGVPTVTPPDTNTGIGNTWDNSIPTTP